MGKRGKKEKHEEACEKGVWGPERKGIGRKGESMRGGAHFDSLFTWDF